jgi:hypothetical protein
MLFASLGLLQLSVEGIVFMFFSYMKFIASLLIEEPDTTPITFKLFEVDENLFYTKPVDRDRPELHFGIIDGHVQLVASSSTKPIPAFVEKKFIRNINAYIQRAKTF